MLVKNLHNHGLVNGSIGKIETFSTVADAVKQGITIGRLTRTDGSGQEVPLEEDPGISRLPKERVWPVVRFISCQTLLCVPLEFSVNSASGKPEVSRNQVCSFAVIMILFTVSDKRAYLGAFDTCLGTIDSQKPRPNSGAC
ncbi:hypothetical protein L218DRAFT_42970 [Marasmius fiardii PR-910]|nr:hypothetical protein L218DRAFT_42970 [Marasmius fiardii PR-910]